MEIPLLQSSQRNSERTRPLLGLSRLWWSNYLHCVVAVHHRCCGPVGRQISEEVDPGLEFSRGPNRDGPPQPPETAFIPSMPLNTRFKWWLLRGEDGRIKGPVVISHRGLRSQSSRLWGGWRNAGWDLRLKPTNDTRKTDNTAAVMLESFGVQSVNIWT